MNEKLETNKNYETVGDDDVLLFGQATFLVRRLKELAGSKLSEILGIAANGQYIMDWMRELKIDKETKISGGDINWKSPQEGIDCQIIKISSKGWQKGKIQIEVNKNIKSGETQTSIKFCPDEPLEPKSPLDDIRQSEAYKKLLENN
ncbi:MAG: KGK domain-containing protein [Microcoleus sp.]